jgi:membrane-bound lytic murein transglycosylase D
MYIYEYHKEHGIKPERALVQHFATDTVMIKKQMSFKQISDLLDIPVAQLQLLNPSYKMNVIPVYGDQEHFLRLPKDKIAIFASNENKIYAYIQRDLDFREKPFQGQKAIVVNDTMNYSTQRVTLPKTKYYTVKSGDNLSEIADKYSVTVSDIKKWNRLKGSTVARGKSLKIITNENVAQTVKKEPKSINVPLEIKTDTLSTKAASFYVVQKGDNLNSIAKKNNVSVADIKEWNHLSNAPIQLGMSLQVAQIEPNDKEIIASTTKTENVEYIVKKGDNLGNIAKKFGSSVDDLKQWNNLQDHNIALGSSLIVAKSEVAIENNNATSKFNKNELLVSTSKTKNNDYLVKKGDSLYSISKKYPGVSISDIEKWNNIKGKELKPGMKLKING